MALRKASDSASAASARARRRPSRASKVTTTPKANDKPSTIATAKLGIKRGLPAVLSKRNCKLAPLKSMTRSDT